jgi:hypothetical protein
MSDFKMINLKKMGNPTIYSKRDSFIYALDQKLDNEDLVVSVDLIRFEDTRANVLINDTVVGMIVSYYENIEIPDGVLLYFVPNINFFKFIDMSHIENFINLSNQFMDAYVENITIKPTVKQMGAKQFEDFDFDLSASKTNYISGTVFNKKIECVESSRFVFNLIKDGSSFMLVDDFKMTIKNRSATMFDIIGTQDYAIFESNKMFSASLSKNGDTYRLNHECADSLHSISFSEHDPIPDMRDYISVIFYYSIMKTNKLETPSIEDFVSNFNDYKQVIEMSLI